MFLKEGDIIRIDFIIEQVIKEIDLANMEFYKNREEIN